MKKIVSLVLALVLVLAIAAPAMAITGYEKPVAPTQTPVAPYGGGISLVAAPQGNTLGILSLSSPATNKAYIANEVVFFRVDLTLPAEKDVTMAPFDYANADMTITSTAATLLGMEGYVISNGSLVGGIPGIIGISGETGYVAPVDEKAKLNTTFNTLTIDMPGFVNYARQFVYIGTGIVKAQGEITATIKGGCREKFQKLEDVKLYPNYVYHMNDNLGNTLYDVWTNDGSSVKVSAKDANGVYIFQFNRDAKFNVTNVCYSYDGGQTWHDIHYKSLAQGGEEAFVVVGINDAAATAIIKARMEAMFSFFGFTWDAKGLLLDGHFTQKLNSFYATDSVTVNLYTQAITVPDPDVEIPQTGDAATTIGFVMVAMAIVAAAAVAYKKVRA